VHLFLNWAWSRTDPVSDLINIKSNNKVVYFHSPSRMECTIKYGYHMQIQYMVSPLTIVYGFKISSSLHVIMYIYRSTQLDRHGSDKP
jgi:hypothetical protein